MISAAFPNFLSGQLKKQRTLLYAYAFTANTVPPCNELSFAAPCAGNAPRLDSRRYQSQPRSLCAQSDAELNQLKAQMQQMQQDYEKRLAAMESQVKSMQSQVALTASVAKSRTITGPDGKAVSMEGPVLMPAFDTFTRNFKFHLYLRAGVGFTANGVGQTFSSRPRISATVDFVWATKTTSILRRVRSGTTCSERSGRGRCQG